MGGTLEGRSRYNKTRCFDPFPFPNATISQQGQIRAIAEELDALRRIRLDEHPFLTMTGLYNVLEKLRRNQPLTAADRDVHDVGQVSLLRHLHDTLDRAVAEAYGWRPDLSAAEIVAHVVALNRQRRAEEAEGLVRWLRPAFQAPAEAAVTQRRLAVEQGVAETAVPAWPATDPDRYVALRAALVAAPGRPDELARRFRRARSDTVREMLKTLVALGQARPAADGRYHV